jgi:hypothetical protein
MARVRRVALGTRTGHVSLGITCSAKRLIEASTSARGTIGPDRTSR